MRKIFIVIERRADYSRYKPILEELRRDPFFGVHLVVTGICLLESHGEDIRYIEEDGFRINARIPMFLGREDSPAEMVRALGRVLLGLVDELEKSSPDLVLSGFDIGGNLAVTIAAAHMNIPVAHIQGGEVTGSIDESIRHAMSKFAHIHFPATVEAKKRLIRLGENPAHIYVVGCPSIDVLKKTPHVPLSELEDFFSIDFREPVILMIQHPVTTEYGSSLDQIRETIRAINDTGVQAVAMLPNNDAGFSSIVKEIKTSRLKWFPSLPTLKFINLYRNVSAIVGNSSSGIHEAATFGIPAVNIGNRQQGRMHSFNVLDVPHDAARIREAIEKALYDRKFRARVRKIRNPYGDGDSAGKIVKILREISLDGLMQKRFYE